MENNSHFIKTAARIAKKIYNVDEEEFLGKIAKEIDSACKEKNIYSAAADKKEK